MENQHRHIKGYRDLSPEEVALMNEIKAEGERLQALLDRVGGHLRHQAQQPVADSSVPFIPSEPARWLSMARTDMQVGLMKLTRAVAQPTSF